MAPTPQQIQQALDIIEAQLRFLKTAFNGPVVPSLTPATAEEGVVGTFDGEFMTLSTGKRIQVPPNYASKSMLVPGDTLRMIESPDNDPAKAKFKQIGKVERSKATGLLTRKDGKFEVLTEEGSFKVLTAAIKHYFGEPGDSVTIQYPQTHIKGGYAAVEKVHKAQGASRTPAAPAEPLPVAQIVHAAPTPEAVSAVVETPPPAPVPQPKPAVVEQPKAASPSKPVAPAKPQAASRPKPKANISSSDRPASPSDRTKAPTRPRSENPRPAAPAPRPAPREINLDTATPSGEITLPDPIGEDDLV